MSTRDSQEAKVTASAESTHDGADSDAMTGSEVGTDTPHGAGSPGSSAETAEGSPRFEAPSVGSSRRWWWAVCVGLIVALPLAWLLSYGASLFFLLGLFFFALFGLVIGAATYRVAAPARPYPQRSIVIGTTFLVLFTWTFALVKESRDFPSDIASRAAKDRGARLKGRTIDVFQADVREEVRDCLRRNYPPGGTLGYIRWIITSGELKPGDLPSVRGSMRPTQTRWWWVIRVALSVALLAFGVGSQTLSLQYPSEAAARGIE